MSLEQTANDVFKILGEANIPAEIIGGYALSYYGYVRNTLDIDIVVSSHQRALEVLKAHGFTEGEKWFKLVDPKNSTFKVDVLPSGKRMSGNTVANPTPSQVSSFPIFTSLFNLVESKMGVVVSSNSERADQYKNKADISYLIKINNLPQSYMDRSSEETIILVYQELWKEIEEDRLNINKRGEWVDPFEEFLNF